MNETYPMMREMLIIASSWNRMRAFMVGDAASWKESWDHIMSVREL